MALTKIGGFGRVGAGAGSGRTSSQIFAGPSFSPSDITGLKLWLDASDASSFTLTGSLIDQWSDKSGEGNHATQGTADNRPSRVTNVLNGQPVVRFDGTNDNLTLPDLSSLVGSACTLFFVAMWKTGDESSGGGVVAHIRNGDGTNFLQFTNDASTPHAIAIQSVQGGVNRYGSGASGADTIIETPYDSYKIWTLSLKASPAIYLNAASQSLLGTTVRLRGSGTTSKLGSRVDGAVPLEGDIAEVLFYNSTLSDSDRGRVHTYLSGKYGITLA